MLSDRVAGALTGRTRAAIVATVLVVLLVGVGAPLVDSDTSMDQFQSDSPEADALDYLEANFTGEVNTSTAQVIVRGENVLSKESLAETLAYQQQLHDTPVVDDTLVEEGATASVANAVATTLYYHQQSEVPPAQAATEDADRVMAGDNRVEAEQEFEPDVPAEARTIPQGQPPGPTLTDQREALDRATPEQVAATVSAVLSEPTGDRPLGGPLALMPTDYVAGSAESDATVLVVTHHRGEDPVDGIVGQDVVDAQVEMRAIGDTIDELEFLVLGEGLVVYEINQSMADSLIIVGPLALLFVLVALSLAYRDALDIALGLVGIGLVLLMTFGFMGWAGIAFNQVFVAIPVLLIGLSIDYAIHVFMRHREARDTEPDLRRAMAVALSGVGVALVVVTATTAIGFLSNLVSPVPPIREFGLVAAAGIVSALLVFGVLVPALKVELDEALEARGYDRRRRAVGTRPGGVGRILALGATAAHRAPVAVIVVALVLGGAGVIGGVGVDTTFDQRDFLADDPPEWTKSLPGPFGTDTYTTKTTLDILNERFVRADATVDIVVRGPPDRVASGDALRTIRRAEQSAAARPTTQRLPTGEAAIDSPLALMYSVAATDEEFHEVFEAADTTGDRLPDQNVSGVYDALFRAAPDRAGDVVHRTEDGQYRALRLTIGVRGDAAGADVTRDTRTVAGTVGDGLTATATGVIILNELVQEQLFDTVAESLFVTLVSIALFLGVLYRRTDGSLTLGAVVLAPVALAAAWILGSMFLLSVPFNVLTGMILSLTIGLGVAYSIHISERYTLELAGKGPAAAMHTAVTGTGGALLGSAATTVGGFGVLVFAILPPLQQFGLITALSIGYAFLASVFVLPALLALWTRFVDRSR